MNSPAYQNYLIQDVTSPQYRNGSSPNQGPMSVKTPQPFSPMSGTEGAGTPNSIIFNPNSSN